MCVADHIIEKINKYFDYNEVLMYCFFILTHYLVYIYSMVCMDHNKKADTQNMYLQGYKKNLKCILDVELKL